MLFALYLSRVFKEVEQQVEGCVAMSFADDCGWLMVMDSVEQLCGWLEREEIRAVEWVERNHVALDNFKDEIIAFTRRQKPDLKRKLADAMIMS